ncbi:MAG TPA: hypothetical protein VHZ09_01730 [Acidobacteriaceae bacterium]|jgi:hypothetical protein|nr:hypothetical protein [Acidobacteriaceae bacterium]
MGPHFVARWIAALLLATFTLTTTAQQIAPISKREAAVRKKTASLALQAPISVIPLHAPEEFGTFTASDAQGITFYDIDSRTTVTLPYSQIRKIKNGYGGYNGVQHRHVDRTHTYIVEGCVAAALGGLIAAAAMAKN